MIEKERTRTSLSSTTTTFGHVDWMCDALVSTQMDSLRLNECNKDFSNIKYRFNLL